jgi:hypothetical protein
MANICKNCKHCYVQGKYMSEFFTVWTHYCRKVETQTLDLVTGVSFTNKVNCEDRRKIMLGDECLDFEQREVKQESTSKRRTSWWNFWS